MTTLTLSLPHNVQWPAPSPVWSTPDSLALVNRRIVQALAKAPQVLWAWSLGQPHPSGDQAICLVASDQAWVLYDMERGQSRAIAAFSSLAQAADYLVFLLTQGRACIDWAGDQ